MLALLNPFWKESVLFGHIVLIMDTIVSNNKLLDTKCLPWKSFDTIVSGR